MTKRFSWLSLTLCVVVALFVGGLFGWFVRGGWTAAWVAATGTWAGALGTVAAILWAVHSFRLERHAEGLERQQAVQAARDLEERTADQVAFTCLGAGGYGGDEGMVSGVRLVVTNATTVPVEVLSVSLDEAEILRKLRSSQLVGAGNTWDLVSGINPALKGDEALQLGTVPMPYRSEVTYRINGVSWVRTPSEKPRRLDPLPT
ncbi:hypothetical protein JTZ10_10985 [Gordonia rubripertincta]|uniref:DUF4352 domain-containing protein n=1 Tax=Gordonia rubripertincta TaxID=36822 RepID=A0AAW4G4E7_GORRU|nr:hypothetical protein [Gordonia rubripertincta]MBM7278287.1 hypothetical protein [Gordonia rubripertincta]